MEIKEKEKNYYEILGIYSNATQREIKQAFNDLARKYHPDKNTNLDTEKIKDMEEKFKKVRRVFTVLYNPATKSKYDQTLKKTSNRISLEPNLQSDEILHVFGLYVGPSTFSNSPLNVSQVKSMLGKMPASTRSSLLRKLLLSLQLDKCDNHTIIMTSSKPSDEEIRKAAYRVTVKTTVFLYKQENHNWTYTIVIADAPLIPQQKKERIIENKKIMKILEVKTLDEININGNNQYELTNDQINNLQQQLKLIENSNTYSDIIEYFLKMRGFNDVIQHVNYVGYTTYLYFMNLETLEESCKPLDQHYNSFGISSNRRNLIINKLKKHDKKSKLFFDAATSTATGDLKSLKENLKQITFDELVKYRIWKGKTLFEIALENYKIYQCNQNILNPCLEHLIQHYPYLLIEDKERMPLFFHCIGDFDCATSICSILNKLDNKISAKIWNEQNVGGQTILHEIITISTLNDEEKKHMLRLAISHGVDPQIKGVPVSIRAFSSKGRFDSPKYKIVLQNAWDLAESKGVSKLLETAYTETKKVDQRQSCFTEDELKAIDNRYVELQKKYFIKSDTKIKKLNTLRELKTNSYKMNSKEELIGYIKENSKYLCDGETGKLIHELFPEIAASTQLTYY